CARGDDSTGQLGVAARVVPVDTAAEHRDRAPAAFQRTAVRFAVDPTSEAADHHNPARRQFAREGARDLGAVGGARTRADDCDARIRQHPYLTAHEEVLWRVVELCEQRRITRIAPGKPLHGGHLQDPSSVGDRYDSASATCSAPTEPAPASAAIVP